MPEKEGKDLSMFAQVKDHEERYIALPEHLCVSHELKPFFLSAWTLRLLFPEQVKNTEVKMESKFDRLFGVVETALKIGDRLDERKHVERMAKPS